MSFLYKTMMTRAPNKRKIKINEENLLRLMSNSDDEDDEDEDFTISPDKKEKEEEEESGSEDAATTDSSANEADKSDSNAEDAPRQDDDDQPGCSSNIRKATRRRKKMMVRPTVKGLNDQITSEYYGMPSTTMEILMQAKRHYAQMEASVDNMEIWPAGICGVCLNEDVRTQSRRLITCQKCGVQVHEDCYNIQHCGTKKTSLERQWVCDTCIYGGDDAVCQFCPNLWGCMKETKCGRWVHIVCARSILEGLLDETAVASRRNVHSKSTVYIQLGEMNSKQYGSKECILCEDRLVSKTGICIKCDAGLCKSTFHVTCAQRHGLLSKAHSGSGDSPCNGGGEVQFANCPLHCDREEMKARQKSFILHLKSTEIQMKKFKRRAPQEVNAVMTRISELREGKARQRDSFLPPRPPFEQVPRLLSSDAHFTRLLNSKAEKMFGTSTKLPAMVIPKATEIRKKYYVTPSLTTDFAAYFLDRELRLGEEKAGLAAAIKMNCELLEKQEYERMKYNEMRSTLIASKSTREELKHEYESLMQMVTWVSEWASSEHATKTGAKRRKNLTPRRMPPPREMSVSPASPPPSKEPIPDAESLINLKTCGICRGQENQHMLARCDVCKEWQHLGCLDPPLTQMPKRTKFSLWQCSECADSSSSSSESDNRGSFTSQDGRRLTRRMRRAPDKLAIGFPDGPSPRTAKASQRNAVDKQPKSFWQTLQNFANHEKTKNEYIDQVAESRNEPINRDVKAQALSSQPHKTASTGSFTLPFGASCDNYLSLAARMPIINQTEAPPQPSKASPPMRKIIVLKRSVPSSPNRTLRPAGLGQKRKLFILPKSTSNAPVDKSAPASTDPPRSTVTALVKSTSEKVTPVRGISGKAAPPRQTRIVPVKDDPPKVTPFKTLTPAPVKGISGKIAPPKAIRTTRVKSSPVKATPPKVTVISPVEGISIRPTPPETITAVPTKNAPRIVIPSKKIAPLKMAAPIKCDVCKTCGDDKRIVTCETCRKNYHWVCCDPPLKSNPVSKFMAWECSDCVDEREEKEDHPQVQGEEEATSERRRVPSRKRKPPEVFEPAFHVSNQQKIFQSIAKQKLRKLENPGPSFTTTQPEEITAARCRPVPVSMRLPKRRRTMNPTSLLPLKIWKSFGGVDPADLRNFSFIRNAPGKKSVIKFVPRSAPPQLKLTLADTPTTSKGNARTGNWWYVNK